MKRNKKLMLTAIAAMGVVAMGVGGAGTFAWFQATKAGLTMAENIKSLTVSSDVSLSNVNVTLNWSWEYFTSADATYSADQKIALTNNVGDTKVFNGAAIVDPSTHGGAAYAKATITLDDGAHPTLANQTYVLTAAGQGNVRLSASTTAKAQYADVALRGSHSGTFTYDSTGVASGSLVIFVSLQTNNKYGAEVAASAATGYQAAATYVQSTFEAGNYKVGDAVVSNENYYVMAHAYDDEDAEHDEFSECFEQVELHSADKIEVTAA